MWVSELDGSNLQQLTSFRGTIRNVVGPGWSPDGQNIAVWVFPNIGLINATTGSLRRLSLPDPPGGGKWPSWSQDGQWLYFTATRRPGGIWKVRPDGGTPVQVTRGSGDDMALESLDRKFLYYHRGWPGLLSVWRIPVDGGEETKILDGVNAEGQWTVGPDGIYFFASADEKGRSEMRFYEFATRRTKKILTVDRGLMGIVVSPDGRSIFYPQFDEKGSDLMLVENFH
jgi:Tol biopolymer transport system component